MSPTLRQPPPPPAHDIGSPFEKSGQIGWCRQLEGWIPTPFVLEILAPPLLTSKICDMYQSYEKTFSLCFSREANKNGFVHKVCRKELFRTEDKEQRHFKMQTYKKRVSHYFEYFHLHLSFWTFWIHHWSFLFRFCTFCLIWHIFQKPKGGHQILAANTSNHTTKN